MNINKLD